MSLMNNLVVYWILHYIYDIVVISQIIGVTFLRLEYLLLIVNSYCVTHLFTIYDPVKSLKK